MDILQTIKEYKAKHGIYPNKSVLGKIFDRHPSTIIDYLNKMIKEGKLRRVKREIEGNYEVIE